MLPDPCELLDWDSTFFGIPVGRVTTDRLTACDVPRILEWCWEHRLRCLYFLCKPNDDESVQLAELNQFHLVDIRLELEWRSVGKIEAELSDLKTDAVRPYRLDDKSDLVKIADTAFSATRFYHDHNFTLEQAAALYREWLIKSCDGLADFVLVAPRTDGVGGFITCHIDSLQRGRIGLLGVRSDLQGCGIGRLLVNAAQTYFVKHNINQVQVVTQGRNLDAQRLYQKCGFRSYACNLWYHKWFTYL